MLEENVVPNDRISLGEKIGYSLGDAASNLYWKTFEFYLMIFYTDVFGISAAAIGTILLVTRLADAVADPVMGAIADRTQTRFGHFRPYLIWFALPLAAAGVLTFSTPNLSGDGKMIYAYVTYSLLMFLYSAVNIPYTALMGVMTSNSKERTVISSIRFLGAFTAGILVQYLTPTFVRVLGQGSDVLGWQRTMILYGILAVAMLIACFLTTRERITPPPLQKADLRSDVKALVASRSWQVLSAVMILALAALAIKGSDGAYYFKYFIHKEQLLPAFLVSNGFAFVAAVAVASFLAKIFGKKALFIFAIGVGGLVIGGFWMARPTDITAIFALQIVSSFIIGFNSPLVFAMFADVADETEWRSGRRNTGLVFASAIFSTKAGWAIGAWLFGLLLSYFGYVPNVMQTAWALFGVVLATSWVPCALMVSAALLMQFYPLTEAQMVKIESDLKIRRGG
ncbi:MAG: MFS transporter [Rhizomicrobium sp.]|nr:MFS transporter [Rhizomicrobium sp.]